MALKNATIFYPENCQQWRAWLMENHAQMDGVWLILYKRHANKPTINWSAAVDEALCFGWIDSIKKKVDADSSAQFFSKRKAKSTWSKINKRKAQALIDAGKMTAAGYKSIEMAQQNGSWNLLDEVEELVIPADLAQRFDCYPSSSEYFSGLSKSVKKMMLQWVALAKQVATREKRIEEIAVHASKGQKPKSF